MITLQVKCKINRDDLIFAAAYLIRAGENHPYLMKKQVLDFLRQQLSLFGTEVLKGEDWEEELKEYLPKATVWVNKRFKDTA